MSNESDLTIFEKKINIKFKNHELLKQVFVHRSYLNENPRFGLDNNERLEFLGDAVLELIVTEYLYKKYENPEGELTNWRSALVKGIMLSKIAEELNINKYLFLSRGEQKSTGKARQIILANAFEALIGAIYLDQGYDIAKEFVSNVLIKYLKEIIEKELYRDAKSRLQELSQEINAITPVYKVISESGPDHAKVFVIGVYIGDKLFGEGAGDSKQDAEQKAAEAALEKVQEN
jgi:ribonuclease-3